MRKMTKAYQLKPMLIDMVAFQYRKHNTDTLRWYPLPEAELSEKETFIRGFGWVKILQYMRKSAVKIPNLSENWTAQDLKDIADKFSLDVAWGMLQGWSGQQSLFSDGSVGLTYAKHEVWNMTIFGKEYDDFTDKVHEVGMRFVKAVFNKGYRKEHGGSYMWYQDKIVGAMGLYEKVRIHPSQHVDHLLSGIVHTRPMFDPISFDELLRTLIGIRKQGLRLLDKYVSVKDRIKFLSSQRIANDIEKIFEWQKVFDHKE